MLGRLSAKLNLTDAQKQQAQSIFSAARQSAQPLRAQLRQQRQALQAAVKSGAPEAQIDQLSSQMAPLMAQATAIHSKAFAKFYSILTPDQRTLLDQSKMNRRHAG
jgi:Spy/CpxP family protein refolding chaperone